MHYSQETLSSLRRGLPPLSQARAPSPELREFCHYYGIDFERHLPEVEHHIGYVKSGVFSLAVHRYLRAGAHSNVLLVHGYLDHSGLFGRLIEYCLNRGSNVLIFDLPGHGLSSGAAAVIDNFKDYGRAIASVIEHAQLPPLPWWAMAQSTGCSALIEYARETTSWPFDASVFLAPLIRPWGWNKVRLAHALVHRFVSATPRSFSQNSSDQAFLDFVKEDPLQATQISTRWVGALRLWLRTLPLRDLGLGPVLIVQGEADRTVAWRRNMKDIQQLIPQCEIQYLPGAGHHLANESELFRQQYMAHIDHYLENQIPLP